MQADRAPDSQRAFVLSEKKVSQQGKACFFPNKRDLNYNSVRQGTGENCVTQCHITIVPTLKSLSAVRFSAYMSKMSGKPDVQCLVWSPELDVSEVSENSDRLLLAMTTI